VIREEAIVPSAIDTPDLGVMAKLLSKRFGCRGFQPNPVARSIVHRIVTLAQLTASWCNSQPWQVVITEGAGTERFRRALFDHATAQPVSAPAHFDFPGPQYSGAYLQRRREVGWQLYQSVGVARGDRAGAARQALENFRLFGAPHVAIISTDRDLGAYGAIDCGAYVSNFVWALPRSNRRHWRIILPACGNISTLGRTARSCAVFPSVTKMPAMRPINFGRGEQTRTRP